MSFWIHSRLDRSKMRCILNGYRSICNIKFMVQDMDFCASVRPGFAFLGLTIKRARLIDDPDHSEDEDRFVLLGLSSSLRLLRVCHCYREEGRTVRIISAHKATSGESNSYL